ncbi:sigma-70 family RNA polymerase sigma factor [Pseudomonas entomophila]|uniref:sigma-70 family RNA polymerase sigma factor n=1 Tax=Pseudomonas entomophila TaxID=312306 RepID=UPI0023D7E3C0|nr:sigma-70 family RNA polymerase sigma factor [Pseudomonas entomophila]MDF0734260.1 sigma-70 family RNA polymerase sigma factor [Pseudomonas entomophila]
MERHYRELVNFLVSRLGNRQAAEDVAHDACVRMLERGDAPPIERPRAFLYRVAQNLLVDRHRRLLVRKAEPLEALDDDAQPHSPAPAELMQAQERLALMQRALAELSAPCRESFLLRKLDGLSHPQIAERLGISRSLVEKHIVTAMKHCRLRMRQWEQ